QECPLHGRRRTQVVRPRTQVLALRVRRTSLSDKWIPESLDPALGGQRLHTRSCGSIFDWPLEQAATAVSSGIVPGNLRNLRDLRVLRVCRASGLRGSRLFSCERPHDHALPIRIDGDFPITIRAVDAGAGRGEPRHDLRCRMTERVSASAADERYLRTPRVEQFL